MKAPWSRIVLLALLSSCHPPHEQMETTSAAPSALSSVAPTASVTTESGTYAVENLLDLQRKDISRFAYAQETGELFVSFSDPAKMEGKPAPPSRQNELEQWNVSEAKMLFRYELPPPWIADELFPSPDGLLLGARLFRTGDGTGCKVIVFDTVTHKAVLERPCIEPNRWSSVLFTAAGEWVVSNSSSSFPAPEGALSGFDRKGQPRKVDASSLVREERCDRCIVVQNEKGRTDAGLYFTGKDGQVRLVAANHWHDNFALSGDGAMLVTTTWDGEVIGWSTAESRRLFTLKWTEAYGHLAYDKKRDRFLLGDAVYSGTSFLRILTRKP